jgi:hypothetical protein
MEKFEFGSRPWTEKLRDAIQRAVDEAGLSTDYAFSEVYIDPPDHLAEPGVTLGWCARIRGQYVDFTFEPADDVDFQVTTDYEAVLPLARMVFAGVDDADVVRERMVGELVASGKLAVKGDRTRRPPYLENIHDDMAKITA